MTAIGKRLIKIEIDGTDVSMELTNGRFAAADASTDTVTFADAAAGGGKDYTFNGTAVQDPTTDTVWDQVFSNAGTDVPITFIPFGNATPSATQPHFTATATIAPFDGDFLGGDADASTTARQTFDFAWTCSGKPVKVTT